MKLTSACFGIFGGMVVYIGALLVLQTFTQKERSFLLGAMRVRLGAGD
jgi:hypothetical protein